MEMEPSSSALRLPGHCRILIALFCSLQSVLGAAVASAQQLGWEAFRTDATRAHYTDDNVFRVWGRDRFGNVVSRWDDPSISYSSRWVDHGTDTGIGPTSTYGVAAVSYRNAADSSVYEYVYFVGSDGRLHEGKSVNRGAVTFQNYPGPAATLVGFVAATWSQDAFGRYVTVAATTTDHHLWRWVRNVSGPTATWKDATGGLTWATDVPLAATTDDAGSYPSFFGAQGSPGAYRLGMNKWTGSAWQTFDLGAPTTASECNSIAVAQGAIATKTYRIDVFCTRRSPAPYLDVATATSAAATSFPWTTLSLAANAETYRGQTLAADLRPDGTTKAIDAFVLLSDQRIERATRTSSGGLQAPVDLGRPLEATAVYGGFAAVGNTGAFSRLFYPGNVNLYAGWLYERSSTTANNPWEYKNDLSRVVATVPFGDGNRAEGMLAEGGGVAAAVQMNVPTDGTPADNFTRIHFTRSTNDGDTWSAPVELTNVIGGTTYQYDYDPTVVVTDSGRAYVLQGGLNIVTCTQSTPDGSAVYLLYTDDGINFTPILLRAYAYSSNYIIDHPFMDIEHRGGLPDRLHIAWNDQTGPGVVYTYLDDGSPYDPAHEVSIGGNGPPLVVANEMGDVVVGWQGGTGLFACVVNASRTGCVNGVTALATGLSYDHNVPVGSNSIVHLYAASIAISQTQARTAFWCYDVDETVGDGNEQLDVRCGRGTYTTGGVWTLWGPYPVFASNDNKDQFFPEIQITGEDDQRTPDGTVLVTFYDRSEDPGNLLYKARSVVSRDLMTTFSSDMPVLMSLNDPTNLPRGCLSGFLFIGDYEHNRPSLLHAHPLYVTVGNTSGVTNVYDAFLSLGRAGR